VTKQRCMKLRATVFILAAFIVPIAASGQTPAPIPTPVAVSLDAHSTALLVIDLAETPCAAQPRCREFLPRAAGLIARARAAGVAVIFSSGIQTGQNAPMRQPPFLAEVAPAAGEPIVIGAGQDRFYATALDDILRHRGVTTLVLAGWRENGSIVYTAVGANLRNYTVVVADDATSASTDYDVAVGRFQLLTQLNANPGNEPAKKGATTLSRTDLITFR
jgi:nicotinamidase-related amidase